MTATEAGPSDSVGDSPQSDPLQGGDAAAEALPVVTRSGRAETVVRRRRIQSRQKRMTLWQVGISLVFVALLVGLGVVGYRSSLRIGGGTSERVTDPQAPGYVAEPQATPVDLYALNTDDGALAGALMVVPDASGKGGTAVPIPPSLVVPEYEGSPPKFITDLYAEGGLEGLQDRMGVGLQFKIGSAESVPAAALAQLAGGSPITIENVDNLTERSPDGTETVRYPAGELTLQPEEIAGFLAFQGADDPAPNQALRAQAVWEQLFERAKGADLKNLPGGDASESSTSPGFGPAIESLVGGDLSYDSVPLAKVPVPDSYLVAWMPDPGSLNDFVARVVPLPRSPAPGVRTPVRLLNGTKADTAVPAAVPLVVSSGGEVILVGNADSFDVSTTTVEYADEAAATVADAIAKALGVRATSTDSDLQGAEVNVVLGTDRAG